MEEKKVNKLLMKKVVLKLISRSDSTRGKE